MELRSGGVDERQRTRRTGRAVLAALACVLAGCGAARRAGPPATRPFDFATDTFAFANETVLEYRVDAQGHEEWIPRQPRPPFSLRCTVVARAARQFFLEARFAPDQPRVDDERYRALVREVIGRSPRDQTASRDPVVIPGFADLRSFSAAHEALLQDEMRSWTMFFGRANWRLIFPFTPANQESSAT